MKKNWICIFLLFNSLICIGQSQKINISGVIKDSLKQPLAFATVTLSYQKQPKGVIRSTYSNDKGNFQFNKIDTGEYLIEASYTGFVTVQVKIKITSTNSVNPLEIILSQKLRNLKEVKLETKKPLIEQEADRIIFNVESDPMAKTETAIDILRKTPFISVDGENNIEVNGQSNFRVLLNGKESALFARNVKEALKGFPGALIVKIEVITSPSAKYDAEGVGGIINIVTIKKTKGYNGSVSASYTTLKRYNHSVNFSIKSGKWGLNISHFLNNGGVVNGRGIAVVVPSVQSVYTRRTEDGKTSRSNFGTNQNFELAFEADSFNTISAYAAVGKFSGDYISDDLHTTEFSAMPPTMLDVLFQDDYNNPQNSLGVDYIRKYRRQKEKEFSVRLNREYGKERTHTSSIMQLSSGERYNLNSNTSPSTQYTVQSDYILPFKNGKLESGGKIVFRRASSDFESMLKYDANAQYEKIAGNNDYFDYEQDVYAVYSSYSSKWKKINFRLGLRMEHTRINGDFVTSHTKILQQYSTLLPNMLVSAKPGKIYTIVIAYNKRMQRPYIWNLNPFINNTDSLNISYGNPDLDPQLFHVLSVQNRFQQGNTFWGITVAGRYSGNSIVSVASFDNTTGITSNTSANAGKDLQFTLNSSVNTKFTPAWNFSVNINLTYNRIKNRYLLSQVNEGFGGNGNLNTSYIFSKKFSLNGNAGFWRPPVTFQTKRRANSWYSIGTVYKFLKDKLTASLAVENFIKKNIETGTTTSDINFTRTLTFIWPARSLRVGLNYNFGKLREGVSKKKGVSHDDLMGKDTN